MSSPTALLSSLSPPSSLSDLVQSLTISIRPHLSSQAPSNQTFLPSYISSLPHGHESGLVLAVDLGGSTLRVAVIRLEAGGKTLLDRKEWGVGDEVRRMGGEEFFAWVAGRIAEVVGGGGRGMDGIEGIDGMGLTWSFPIVQTAQGSGRIMKMGKGFRMWEGMEGRDLREGLEEALRERGIKIPLLSLLNDTTATLLSHAYTSPRTRIALIVGTGCNAALPLPVALLAPEKFQDRPLSWMKSAQFVLVNTEASMLGGGIFPLTPADETLDRESEHPGYQPFEQLTSGRYLGEVVRLTLLQAGIKTEGRWSFPSALMGTFESNPDEASNQFSALYGIVLSPEKKQFIADVCKAVAKRAAAFLAVLLAALYKISGERGDVVVACCGAVIEKHPSIRKLCQEFLDGIMGGGRIVLEVAEDSGLMGAAVGVVLAKDEGGKPRL